MKVLVLCNFPDNQIRKTILDHLYCFRSYLPDVEFHYCNILKRLPFYLRFVKYDAIIFHYTYLSIRWNPKRWNGLKKDFKIIRKMPGIKIAIPQDEYAHTNDLCHLFKECGVETVFTCANPIDYENLYPKKVSGLKWYFTTLTGFVDENTRDKINSLLNENHIRDIDIGYRARNLPYWLGSFGQLKVTIAKKFNEMSKKTPLKMDISNDEKDVFYGDDWLRFILRCRTMLGSLGGASMCDPNGAIRESVEKYMKRCPKATFQEAENACFKGLDNTLQLFALSPRHFECAMAKTCQVLVEGDYQGVLLPNHHYIEIKKDFSNIEDVLIKIADKSLCNQYAEQAYKDIVLSDKYTYRKFAQGVMDHIRTLKKEQEAMPKKGFLKDILFFYVGITLKLRDSIIPLNWFARECYCFLYHSAVKVKRRLKTINN